MIVRKNVPIYKISWLNFCHGGIISTFYEPETKEELVDLCRMLYGKNISFDIIGHTSNIYYLPNYNVEVMVSTRKVNSFEVGTEYVVADCGVSVRKLARRMVDNGVAGFEGLIDLPGTVAASVYNNSSCFNCSINRLVESFDILLPNGSIETKTIEELNVSRRSTVLKQGILKGVIISVKMRTSFGDALILKRLSEKYHHERQLTQPAAQNNLGSIYCEEGKRTVLNRILVRICCIYGIFMKFLGFEENVIINKRKHLFFSLLFCKDLLPYVYNWNRFIWRDEKSHRLFWKYHHRHRLLYTSSKFEIEIKG